ncbi:MAG TPA: carbon-nitrogen hydrolase family protein [Verrucomicrobiae bacterium]|nr:carbon-nitrogen hydrolase family protein [Verrucomicrobiae bacterium]
MRKKFLRVAAAQMKFRPTIEGNLAVIDEMISAAADAKCDVVLFPECALTGYNVDFSKFSLLKVEGSIQIVRTLAKRKRINVILGSPTFGKKSHRFNSLVVIDREGRETFRYHKIHLTARDATCFEPGNAVALFDIDDVPCTAIICHERRYPELVRLPVMMGAQIVFHANAGLDSLAISKSKRRGRDGIAMRAFENEIYYVFANSVGPQGDGLWSAGDSKIVGPDMKTLALANNRDEMLIHAQVDLQGSRRKYAVEALEEPAFLRPYWKKMLGACKRQSGRTCG